MRLIALVGVALSLVPLGVHAQTCAGGAVLVKNDTMAANLVWPFQSRPITSLGAGDAAGCVFDVSGIAPVVRVDSAAVGFANGFNQAGIQAPYLDTISIAGSPIHSPGTGVVTLHFPVNPGVSYVGAASFATSPGIPTPIGIVPLADDALLALSLTTPSVFVGFGGALDAAGTATGAILVPPGIGPASFFIAAVAYASTTGQLLAITNPAPVAVW